MELERTERFRRAQWWPVGLVHYWRRLWYMRYFCYPPLGLTESIKLANMHFHSWVWGHIGYDDTYLPTRSQNDAKADQS
jgi:hypothetical protein